MTDYRFLSLKTALVALTLLTAVFRIHALFANSFHADEALFASWARLIAVWRDPLLATVPVDKPPLLFYVQALFFPLLGPVEWAARLPNLMASILLVPLVGVGVWRWYRDEKTAVFAAALVALSPLHIQFSATAFTDPLLVILVVGALVTGYRLQVTGEKFNVTCNLQLVTSSGVLFGLAAATKHQAWLFLPLVVGTAVLSRWGRHEWRRWLTGFLPVWGLVAGWEIARTGSFSLWTQQMRNFGGLRLIWSWELWPRLQSWWILLNTMWGWGITAVFLLAILIWLVASFKNNRTQINADDADVEKKFVKSVKSVVPLSYDWLLACFVLGYFLLHWFVAVPVWDRYLLPLVPLSAVLAARAVSTIIPNNRLEDSAQTKENRHANCHSEVFRGISTNCKNVGIPHAEDSVLNDSWRGDVIRVLFVGLLFVGLLIVGRQGRNGRFPVGGQVNADQGAAEVAEWLDNAPYGTVLYDHWYSWQWRYHLFDKRVFVHWFPHPDALAEDLAAFGRDGSPRYLVLPKSDVVLPVYRAVESGGFRLEAVPLSSESGMILYRVVPED